MDNEMTEIPKRQIRAVYDEETIRVYQAYGSVIADSLIDNGRFVDPPFKLTRMTWIKPSFLWMMYRCGWSYKDDGQRRVFAFDIRRDGFEWALANSCSSHPEGLSKDEARELMDANPVRVQWDPERDVHFNALEHRSIQVGLTREAIRLYATEWIVHFEEVTDLAKEMHELVTSGDLDAARRRLPEEWPYALSEALATRIGAVQ